MPAPLPCLLMLLLCMLHMYVHGAKRWAGGSTGDWNNTANWNPEGLPGKNDTVLLNNEVSHASYTVSLPENSVDIYTLIIEPADGNTILLVLPVSNVARPALVIGGSNEALIIRKGGVFKNSSGLASGESIQMSGLIGLYNGGKYIHNTRSSHAIEIVARLSTAPGTERGIFEFNVPGGSYPISLSNRTYGDLVLSSGASGGAQTYNASGTNPVVIRGDLVIGNGIQFNLDISKEVTIHGNFMQNGGVFNMASQPNTNVVIFKGNLTQTSGAVITETSSGLPVIELAGNIQQEVSLAGSITNNITVRVNNGNGARLHHQLVLGYKLVLVAGKIKTNKNSCLVLLDNGVVEGGSYHSFVDGPLRKIGDEDFEFPIGRQGDYAPLKLSGSTGQVTDEFSAEYFLDNPVVTYGAAVHDPSVVRISTLEYWIIEQLSGKSYKRVTLPVSTYSGATALDKLVVAGWNNSFWVNFGNSFYQGIATGKISSEDQSHYGVFTLASTTGAQNPLDLNRIGNPTLGANDIAIGKHTALDQIRIYPTIVNRTGKLILSSGENLVVTTSVCDLFGRPLRSKQQFITRGNNSLNIGVNDFKPGLYVLQIQSKERSRAVPFVVVK